ncbi:MAG TPA: insulinase family protein [Pseudomonadales bacterium]|nr:insulinase family protein [Pseudomonadales bacterium]
MRVKAGNFFIRVTPFAWSTLFVLSVLFTGAANAEENAAKPETVSRVLETPVKSANDQRGYRSLVLNNGMKVLLISDPRADKSAASLDVATGSVDDPRDRQGLAHFLEHMLFLGTDKYPKSGEYQEFISAHGGSHNAFTAHEHTNFFFDVDPDNFHEGLDRFAQFFIAPTFDVAYVDREKNAVNSEYQARIRDDDRRIWDVYREIFSDRNPAATFSVGNLATLSDNQKSKVRDDLLGFYETHYSANIMTLVVSGREPLPQLQQWVEQIFVAVPDRHLHEDMSARPVFPDGFLPARLSVNSVKSERHLEMVFPMPSQLPQIRIKPSAYVSYLLGHEGEGSLFANLKSRGWAEKLSAGNGLSTRFASTFDVDVTLTEEGYRHVDDIAMLFFQAVDMLQNKGVENWQYQEQKSLLELDFQYREKQEATEYVSELATAMHYYPSADILRGPNLMEHFDPGVIREFLSGLRPDNVLLTISAPDIKGDRQSQYYGASYKVEKISHDVLSLWGRARLFASVKMPEKNPFVPDALKLKPSPLLFLKRKTDDAPQNIATGKNYNLWFKQDAQFKVPKASIMVYARSRIASASAKQAAMSELFVRLLNDHLNSMLYTASLGGLDFAISKRSRGIAFQLTGYSDKQGLLLKSVMDTFRNPVFDETRFNLVKAQWIDELKNADKQSPYLQLMQDMPVVLAHGYWSRQEYLKVLQSMSLKDVQDYELEFTRTIVADVLVYGNFYQAEALKLAQVIENTLNLEAARLPDVPARIVELPPVSEPFLYIDEIQHDDAGLIKYFQASGDDVAQQVRMMMLAQVVKSAFFQSLRTEQQVGYIVNCAYLPMARVPGIAFLVQSPTRGVGDINKKVDAFIEEYFAFLNSRDDAWFEQQRQAVLTQLQEKPHNLAEQSMEYWSDMTLGYTGFNQRQLQAEALQQMTKAELLDVYRSTLLDKNRRQLLVASPGKAGIKDLLDGSSKQYIYVDNTDNLKAQMPSHALQ